MRLTDAELHAVLARAEEIQRGSLTDGAMRAEVEAVIGAAEEIGLSRSAVERALRERLNLSLTPPAPGALVFARSADDKFYAAEVLSTSADGARVRFVRGSEHDVALDQLRPCALIPGENVIVNWPWWGPWTCKVVSFDEEKRRVKLDDRSGSTKTFPLAEIWLPPQPRQGEEVGRPARARMYLTWLGIGVGVGALIGSVATALMLR
jgi:hypothetical protein